MTLKQELNAEEKETLIAKLKSRFDTHKERHESLSFEDIESRLDDKKLVTLYNMEVTEGEPDVIVLDGDLHFVDCSKESPKGRRSVCYDRQALEARKKYKPDNSAVDLANEIGIEILSEDEYRTLQEFGEFDLKSSSWIVTPEKIRSLGGALFSDRRYDSIFVYHNGADSYYGARGFRGKLKI
ncbi:DUF4256 domain-containing protein [Jeotgalicoccus huakuii]|nr:DUF4256 domain-containing protein [Jeotgalicoccus huakuii]